MKQNQAQPELANPQPPPKKTSVDVVVLVGCFVLAALLVCWLAQRSPRPSAGNPAPTAALPNSSTQAAQLLVTSSPPAVALTRAAVPTPHPGALPVEGRGRPGSDPAAEARQWVASLAEVDLRSGSITPEQAARWRQTLQKLVAEGGAAVPSVGEFLAKNVDVDFDPAKGGGLLGYATVRFALFDALRQIGGPAMAVTAQVLRTTADPREIAILSRDLEQKAPLKYRQEILGAAREGLTQAAQGRLEGYDIGPLFEVLQQFGGANVVTDLERVSSQWNFYSVIALGGLAGGAGIPALTRMAQDTAIPNVMALRMLAQMAAKDPAAKAALMAQVRANKIPYAAWTGIAAALGGESIEYGAPVITGAGGLAGPNVRTYHITYGNQNYRTVPVTEWRPVAINEQLAIIDQLVATNLNLEALQFLQDARLSVAGRQSK